MPPKRGRKPKKAAVVQPDPEPHAEEESDGGDGGDGRGDEDDGGESGPSSPSLSVTGEGEEDVFNEKIADFFEGHSHFYDMTHQDYKNKQRRNFELAEFAAVLGHGWTADKVWRRFVSLRTDYGKLKGIVQKGKSGSGAPKWTPKQKWKLTRLQFLNPFIKRGSGPSGVEEEIGKVSISQNMIEYGVI